MKIYFFKFERVFIKISGAGLHINFDKVVG
jgi:hypothetical protein